MHGQVQKETSAVATPLDSSKEQMPMQISTYANGKAKTLKSNMKKATKNKNLVFLCNRRFQHKVELQKLDKGTLDNYGK